MVFVIGQMLASQWPNLKSGWNEILSQFLFSEITRGNNDIESGLNFNFNFKYFQLPININ